MVQPEDKKYDQCSTAPEGHGPKVVGNMVNRIRQDMGIHKVKAQKQRKSISGQNAENIQKDQNHHSVCAGMIGFSINTFHS
jgi:hypothetical protein